MNKNKTTEKKINPFKRQLHCILDKMGILVYCRAKTRRNKLYGIDPQLDQLQEKMKEMYYGAKDAGLISEDKAIEQMLSRRLKWKKDQYGGRSIYLHDIRITEESFHLWEIIDSLICYYIFNDSHQKELIDFIDPMLCDGAYGYINDDISVIVEKGDIVIDAGACSGEFSVYAAIKGAFSYAFEPTTTGYNLLNNMVLPYKENIVPIKIGLGDKDGKANICLFGGGSSIVINKSKEVESINITTIDKYVNDNNIERVDFIKVDIEGAERLLLAGATSVLKNFSPKLAICTYHLQDDPEVLEKIIKDINPKYRIFHTKGKLFAAV